MEKVETVVLEDSPEAAVYRTDIKGWVSRNGIFLGDNPDSERLARWEGSTHKKCETCGELVKRGNWCTPCHDKKEHEAYLKMPKKKWDGEGGICCDGDRFFWSIEEAEDYAADNGTDLRGLDLVICEPQYADEIEDLYVDILPEDQTLDEVYPALAKAIDKVNALIRKREQPISWIGGKYRLDLD
jgi:hypothetical protein